MDAPGDGNEDVPNQGGELRRVTYGRIRSIISEYVEKYGPQAAVKIRERFKCEDFEGERYMIKDLIEDGVTCEDDSESTDIIALNRVQVAQITQVQPVTINVSELSQNAEVIHISSHPNHSYHPPSDQTLDEAVNDPSQIISISINGGEEKSTDVQVYAPIVPIESHKDYQLVRDPQEIKPLITDQPDFILKNSLPNEVPSSILDNDESKNESEENVGFAQRLSEILEADLNERIAELDNSDESMELREVLEYAVEEAIDIFEHVFPGYFQPTKLSDLDLSLRANGTVNYLSVEDAQNLTFYHIHDDQVETLLELLADPPQELENEDAQYNELQFLMTTDGRCFALHTRNVFINDGDENEPSLRPYLRDLDRPLDFSKGRKPLTHRPFEGLKI